MIPHLPFSNSYKHQAYNRLEKSQSEATLKEVEPLSNIKAGTISTIDSVQSTDHMRRRLLDLGFSQGTIIKCVQCSPSGDPVAYMVRGTIIALRNEDANQIMVDKGGTNGWD